MFFAAVYTSSSLVLGAVLSVVSVSTLSTPCLPPALTLGVSLLLASKATFDLDSVVVEPGFVPEAVYDHSLAG
jgi:hypothetical protein